MHPQRWHGAGWRHAGSTIDDIGPDRCNIPRGKIFERRGKGERVEVVEEEGVEGVLMCQLIARKLERIALNDRADVAGLKEGLRGEGKLEGLVSIFFSKDERGKYLWIYLFWLG